MSTLLHSLVLSGKSHPIGTIPLQLAASKELTSLLHWALPEPLVCQGRSQILDCCRCKAEVDERERESTRWIPGHGTDQSDWQTNPTECLEEVAVWRREAVLMADSSPLPPPQAQLSTRPAHYLGRATESLDETHQLSHLKIPHSPGLGGTLSTEDLPSQLTLCKMHSSLPTTQETHPIFCILEAHVLHHNDGGRDLATWWKVK